MVGPIAACCSVVAAVAFASLPVWSVFSERFDPAHPWIFALGAAAFAANLMPLASRPLRVAAALAQAVCVFELLGFSVAVTAGSYSPAHRWPIMQPWEWAATWGLLAVCVLALALTPVARRPARAAS